MKTVVSKQGQNLMDIAIQELGSAEGVFALMQHNPSLSQTSLLPTGTNILIPNEFVNEEVYNQLNQNGTTVATHSAYVAKSGYSEAYYVEEGYSLKQ